MNINSNQHVFEEFQKSVDQAKTLAQKLGPEHFYLAYDRCAKLQKVIFKRACGYCSSSEDPSSSKDCLTIKNENDKLNSQKPTSTTISYLNLPRFSICGSAFPLMISGQSVLNSKPDLQMQKIIMLKRYTETTPTEEEEILLANEGLVISQPRLINMECLQETIKTYLKFFPDCSDTQYEICLPQTANPVLLVQLTNEDFPMFQNVFKFEPTLYLRPAKLPKMPAKVELSVPSPSFQLSDNSVNSTTRINSFMVDATDKMAHINDEGMISEVTEGSVFPETIFLSDSSKSNLDTTSECTKSKSNRRYNWSVVLSNLHENHPTQLRNESVRFPDVCHELHAIPPTPQKLRPTKRCQLCLKGYKSRKESRYYCRPCDKGFHIKCFEVYHQQLGYGHYKVKIINGER